ncbi:MAG TPA: SsrA-binding protein SmpB [Planctomycetota bacterium]|jgi:SsrA-binding protein|nr:SsrA-binding protein SmpB [Planctomycetota bacterium]
MSAGEPKEEPRRSVATNRRATFEFHILEQLECGISLTGTEVKSLRTGQASIAEAFGMVRNGEMYLVNCHIPEYRQGNVHNHEPTRERKLLLHKKEIQRWHARVKEKGITIVPLALYFKGSRAKLAIALCKGKKQYDKREDKRKQEDKREIDRAMSRSRRQDG